MTSHLIRALSAVDWDFAEARRATGFPHWYPATFPRELPEALIQILTAPGDLVFDPYGGAGSSASAALQNGRRILTTDLNLVAVLATYVRSGFELLVLQQPDHAYDVLERVDDLLNRVDRSVGSESLFPAAQTSTITDWLSKYMRPTPETMLKLFLEHAPPQWDELQPWYHTRTLRDIKHLHKEVLSSDLPAFDQLVATLMISAVLRTASSQPKSWGHIADNVFPSELVERSMFRLCRVWLSRLRGTLRSTSSRPTTWSTRHVKCWTLCYDWSTPTATREWPRTKPSLLVTSPPYCGAIDYTYGQRLSLYFFGRTTDEIVALVSQEIGARRRRSGVAQERRWAEQITEALKWQVSEVCPGGYAALVVPHKESRAQNGVFAIDTMMQQMQWRKLLQHDRSIRQSQTRHSWTSIKRETLLVYQSPEE
ncbi:MAG: hypothetical protein H6822_20360 [Planctomycetaceae bacterium]|nr:hypothetical protein [Planctomycetaceae bacterium]